MRRHSYPIHEIRWSESTTFQTLCRMTAILTFHFGYQDPQNLHLLNAKDLKRSALTATLSSENCHTYLQSALPPKRDQPAALAVDSTHCSTTLPPPQEQQSACANSRQCNRNNVRFKSKKREEPLLPLKHLGI